MNNGLRFDSGAATHAGLVRAQNEDNLLARPEIGLWAVADGMGGHEAGGLASAIVIEALRKIGQPDSAGGLLKDCEDALRKANATIRAIARSRGFSAVGSTVVTLLVFGRHFACVWSGDSRIYLARNGAIAQVTHDHSEVQELIDQGTLTPEDAKQWSRRNVITRAIGVFDEADFEVRAGEIEPDDVFLLCSDGLTGHVDDDEICAFAVSHAPQDACAALVDLTLERGAHDNVTIVAVRCTPVEADVTRSAPALGGLR